MILDALNKVYIWVGSGANKEERDKAEETAKKYIATDSIPRKNPEIEVLVQGKETPSFQKMFPKWDSKMWAQVSIIFIL